MPMVEATTKAAAVAAIPITKTTSTIITNLSAASSNGQNKRTIIIYPTGMYPLAITTFPNRSLQYLVSECWNGENHYSLF